ncbi:hypothetical protein RRG08_060941 [Elysia crispata]|uniref:Uncharacterized protein n=1 Tax=Elysia crispata TaxID=231223 RepID=A0AAE1AUH9_9GAST|nr:hypothetical protein RRG08_060941 [Elysia crispata]
MLLLSRPKTLCNGDSSILGVKPPSYPRHVTISSMSDQPAYTQYTGSLQLILRSIWLAITSHSDQDRRQRADFPSGALTCGPIYSTRTGYKKLHSSVTFLPWHYFPQVVPRTTSSAAPCSGLI